MQAERGAQVGQRPTDDGYARVDLLSAVLSRVAEREASGGHADLGRSVGDERVGDVHVAVLDHEARLAAAPAHAPRAHVVAHEDAFDTWLPERLRHDAIELAEPRHRDGRRRRPERRHDAGEHAVALLPVRARHVKGDLRGVAIGRPPAEFDVRRRGCRPTRIQVDPIGPEPVSDIATDRHIAERQLWIERTLRGTGRRRQRQGRSRQRSFLHDRSGRRRDGHLPFARAFGKTSDRPFEQVPPRGGSGQTQPLRLEKIREASEVEVLVRRVPPRAPARSAARLPHPVSKLGRAPKKLRRRLRDVEQVREPGDGSPQVLKSIRVEAGQRAREGPLQLAATLEEMKGAGEVALTGQREAIAGKEQLAHAPELNARLDLVRLFRPASEIDVTGQLRRRAIGREVDAIELHEAAVDLERRPHLRPHRLERLDAHGAAREIGTAAVPVRGAEHRHVQVRRVRAPRRDVILEQKLPARRLDDLERRHPAARPAGPPAFRNEPGKVVPAVRKRLDHHLPVRHGDRADQDLAAERGPPRQHDVDSFRGEERAVGRLEPSDDEVLDTEVARQDPRVKPPDADVAFQVVARGTFGARAEGGPQIHRHRDDDEGREDRRDERERPRGAAQAAPERSGPGWGRVVPGLIGHVSMPIRLSPGASRPRPACLHWPGRP